MSNTTEKKVEIQPVRCGKGMKLPKSIKAMMAMSSLNKADRNYVMRSFGVALQEQGSKARSAPRTEVKK